MVIHLTPNEEDDSKAIIDALIQAANEDQGQTRRSKDEKQETGPEFDDPARTFGNERVEAEAKSRVGEHLREKLEQIVAENKAAGKAPDARRPEPPKEILKKRRRFRRWLITGLVWGFRVVLKELVNCWR